MSIFYLSLPFVFLKFWFLEAPKEIIAFFASLNSAFLKLFSLSILIKTYFQPWKNEYREGLVGFSIGMGMFIKSFVILVDIILFLLILAMELIFVVSFLFLPIGVVLLLITEYV